MFKKLYTLLSIALLLHVLAPITGVLHVDARAESPVVLKPIMIIRFNQPRVYFQKQLATMINEAKKVKPDVVFDVVQYVPQAAGKQAQQTYASNADSVMQAFASNGVANNALSLMKQPSPEVITDEVYIFIR